MAKKTVVIFRQGFTLSEKEYGWMNGELYRFTSKGVKKVRLHSDTKGSFYRLSGRKYRMKDLIEITVPTHKRHIDTKRNWNAYRPDFKKDDFGFDIGKPFNQMNQDAIRLHSQ
jgi:hypothetical protein